MTDFPITIYHNPACATSRNVLGMIIAADSTPTIVEYLKVGWTQALLQNLLRQMGEPPRSVLRQQGTPAIELGLMDGDVSDVVLMAAMVRHPVLVNRPIVVTPKGVRLCRPSETVLPLLDKAPIDFVKEAGRPLFKAAG